MINVQQLLHRSLHSAKGLIFNLIKFSEPKLYVGKGSILNIPPVLVEKGLNNVLVIAGNSVLSMGLLNKLFKELDSRRIVYSVFSGVTPNPTFENVGDALKLYIENNCKGIIAIGGGSVLDCAKIVGARAANPNQSIKDMKGMLKIKKKLPPLYTVPTTAGSGSETTIAAVITDVKTHEKFPIVDLKLMPQLAVLDAELMLNLPPHVTAMTGMDALTHAIEAYIGLNGNNFTRSKAIEASALIFDNLEAVVKNGSDIVLREKLALASFYAGESFTRANVGYVHAIAHAIGGLYGTSHGLANAVLLPAVLESYGKYAENSLAKLALSIGIGDSSLSVAENSKKLIKKIKQLNSKINIPEKIKDIKKGDIPIIAKKAAIEASLTYPTPKFLSESELQEIVRKVAL